MKNGRLLAIVALVGAMLAGAGSSAEGAVHRPTCFGLPATISDHSGTILGTDGDDVIVGNAGANLIRGFGGDDRICSRGGGDRVFGGSGNDLINLGSGHDYGKGGSGVDRILGKRGGDEILGNGGSDVLRGGSGNDQLWGGARGDDLSGGKGNDTLRGGKGPDECDGDAGADSHFSCNERDSDRVVAAARSVDDAAAADLPELLAAISYPVGGWTAEQLSCFAGFNFGIVSRSSIEPTPGWRIPDAGQPGRGEVPDGRIYSFRHSTSSFVAHATIIGDRAYFFPSGC